MGLEFNAATAESAAGRLDERSIHLWRIPYTPAQGRTPLLQLLAAYLHRPASAVMLDFDARGKPRLAPSLHDVAGDLEFNWSHSGDFALAAIARGCDVGVDIERLGKRLRALELARRFFDPREADALAAFAPGQRDAAFIGLWCAKEAVLKATGKGLSFGLARLSFALHPAGEWRLLDIDPLLGGASGWMLHHFAAAPGYRGALAWRGEAREIVALRPSDRD